MPPASRTVDWREALTAVAALETGLLAGFRGGATPQDAARAAGLDARAARVVAAALADQGLLEPAGDGALRTTARGDALLAPAADGTDPAGELHLEVRAIRSHLALADVLRGGPPADDVSAGDRETRERFMRAMRDVTAPRIPAVLAAVGPPPPGGRMLDVGGAPGVHARAFAGDGWDAVHLGNSPHLLDRDEAAPLVARAAAALAPGGLLLIGEVLGDRRPQGPVFGLMMLVSTAGGEAWAEDDYRGWMAAAGAPLERLVDVDDGWHHLLIGRSA